jgi:hypothetical protein
MSESATSLAILDADGRVVTFVRLDAPDGWTPPEGCTAVPDSELPQGWQRAPSADPVPTSISPRQARLWLVAHGVTLAAIDETIGSITDDATRESVRVEWEYGLEVQRSSPWLSALGAALGLDDDALDQAFREAATL